MRRIGILLAIGVSSPALADTVPQQLARCSAIENSVTRLQCFDDLARAQGADRPAVEATTAGSWNVRTERSKIDDSANVFVSTESNEEVLSRFGTNQGKAQLMIRCAENKTSLYIVWAGAFIGSDTAQVTYRIDREPAKTARMYISTDHRATGLWTGSDSVPFIRALFDKKQLLTRVTPFSESPVTVTFDISGIAEAVKPLAKACKWESALKRPSDKPNGEAALNAELELSKARDEGAKVCSAAMADGRFFQCADAAQNCSFARTAAEWRACFKEGFKP
jgi:type VI secretion system protein VasI